ncbi:lysophospholipid acyltransferase [Boothiomyces macroporosus]|uniref:Lysophospholipid acyltransferase n=1 Tax=Boothiomyces macroporosus TaxID=261099 RepID=A0AAD5Y294_9FUNG|nr:lysophospholipid acyltransferase [Boothiomyces macroporosus]
MIQEYAATLGVKVEVIRFALCLFAAFPISALYNFIPSNQIQIKHLYSIITSGIITCVVFSTSSFLQLAVQVLLIYYTNVFFAKYKFGPLLGFGIALAHMSWIHAEAQIWRENDPTFVDYSAMMMVLLIKMSSFSYCVHDGTRKESELDSYQKEYRIINMPSLIEFMGYSFFFNGYWVGPAIEFRHYQRFINQEGEYKNIPSTVGPMLKALVLGLVMIVLETVVGKHYHFALTTSEFFFEKTLFQKLLYINIAGLFVRAKFHSVWKISEASALVSGVGYAVTNGKERFDAAENVDVYAVEFAENPKMAMDGWNKYTANWLRRYVYVRVRQSWLKLPLTFFISAFWHGFYPGYYLSFLWSVPLMQAGRAVRKHLRPVFIQGTLAPYKKVYDAIGFFATLFSLNFLYMPFILRTMSSSFEIWKSMYFIGILLPIVVQVSLTTFGLGKFIRRAFIPLDKKTQ